MHGMREGADLLRFAAQLTDRLLQFARGLAEEPCVIEQRLFERRVVCLFRRGAQTAFAVLGCDDQLVQQLDGIDRVHDSLLANRMSAVAEAGLAMAGAAANGRFSLARSRRAARSFPRIGAAGLRHNQPPACKPRITRRKPRRSEEHTSELQSLMRS